MVTYEDEDDLTLHERLQQADKTLRRATDGLESKRMHYYEDPTGTNRKRVMKAKWRVREAAEERGRGLTNPDKDNRHSLMRLPGGLHESSENLGLWIDVDEGRLYPLEVQAETMAAGFGYPDDHDLMTKETFKKAGAAMLNRITASGVALHELLDRDAAMLHLHARPANPISQAIEAAPE